MKFTYLVQEIREQRTRKTLGLLKYAIDLFGSEYKVAKALGVFPSAVKQWNEVPPKRVAEVSELIEREKNAQKERAADIERYGLNKNLLKKAKALYCDDGELAKDMNVLKATVQKWKKVPKSREERLVDLCRARIRAANDAH